MPNSNSSTPRCLIRGSINVDEFFEVKSISRPGETISSHSLEKRGGGKGANQAVAVAKAGANVDIVGAVGDDGAWVKERLRDYGVNVDLVEVRKDVPTGRAIIQVANDGENSIILFKGANYNTTLPANRTIGARTTHILLQNEVPFSETLAYLDLASVDGRKISTVFNPSPMPTDDQLHSFHWNKLTWLIVNEGETTDLYKILSARDGARPLETPSSGTSSSNSVQIPTLGRLSELIGPQTNIICTLGAKGVLAMVPHLKAKGDEQVYVPAGKLGGPVRDTTGAGDCFTGYFVAGLMKLEEEHQERGVQGMERGDIEQVLKRAVQAAAMCVETPGTMDSVPRGKDVDDRLTD